MGEVEIEDFAGGVTGVNGPGGAGQFGIWYDTTQNTFGTPLAATLDGAPAMRINDGGFTNGVYAIFEAAIPATGTYALRAPIHVVEEDATGFDGIDAYRMGVSVGVDAAHRGPDPSALDPVTAVGSYPGLTDGDDTAQGSQLVTTAEFTAEAGDDVLVAFSTDVTSGGWNVNSGFWNGGYVLVGALTLVPIDVPEPDLIIDNDDGSPAYVETGAWALSGGVGFDGLTYKFTGTGNASTATWSTTLDKDEGGFYEVDVIYRAGTNRAHAAQYSVIVDGEKQVTKAIDQRFQDLSWVRLGLIEALDESEVSIVLDAESSSPSSTVVIADAVRLVKSDGPPPIDPPELRLATITVFDTVDDVGAIQVTVDQLAQLHYNAVAVHARYRGDATYFPNKFDATYPNAEPRSPQAGDVDVLEEFTTRGHNAGLKVFAYVNTHLVTDGTDVAAADHVISLHPEWRTYAYNSGSPVVQTTAFDGEGLWLDPALPEVRDYLADIVGDIASNYKIDGVVLDRIRYPQTSFTRENADFGYHPDAVAEFNLEYGKSGTPDPYDLDWIEFRQLAVTQTVGDLYDRLAEVNPELSLFAFPIGRFNDAINFNYQNWPEWLSGRHIDGVMPQIYTSDNINFEDRLHEHAAAYSGDRLVGVATNAFTAGVDVAGQLELARANGFDCMSPFRHGTMGPLGYLDDLEVAWDGVSECPDMPWKGAEIERLKLTPMCSEEPAVERRWRIRNPNDWSIEATYWLLFSGQHGTYFAPPNDSFFVTDTIPGFNIAVLSWYDEDGKFKFTLRINWGFACTK